MGASGRVGRGRGKSGRGGDDASSLTKNSENITRGEKMMERRRRRRRKKRENKKQNKEEEEKEEEEEEEEEHLVSTFFLQMKLHTG